MADSDALWLGLEPHIDWAQCLVLIFLFAEHPSGVDELRRRCEELVASKQQRVLSLIPRCCEELTPTVMTLAKPLPADVGVLWMELWRGAGREDWDASIDEQLARLNAGRGALERDVGRPFVLVLPEAWRSRVSVVAPDLWTIRGFMATVAAPVSLAGGGMEVPRTVAAEFSPVEPSPLGQPSLAEREWARLHGTGLLDRIDPWDGFQAIDGAMRRGSLESALHVADQVLGLTESRVARVPHDQRARRQLVQQVRSPCRVSEGCL